MIIRQAWLILFSLNPIKIFCYAQSFGRTKREKGRNFFSLKPFSPQALWKLLAEDANCRLEELIKYRQQMVVSLPAAHCNISSASSHLTSRSCCISQFNRLLQACCGVRGGRRVCKQIALTSSGPNGCLNSEEGLHKSECVWGYLSNVSVGYGALLNPSSSEECVWRIMTL